MEVFRIHGPAFDPLDGTGAAIRGSRWNPPGLPVVYAALHYEGAILEQLVQAGIGRLPRNRVVSRIEIAEAAGVEELEEVNDDVWQDEVRTRRIGGEWLRAHSGVALVVPSVVARPFGKNVLINPAHPDFRQVRVLQTIAMTWDPRLFG
ncbi:MAG: RES domain-containing protein [Gemmatimonadota bacterium]